MRDRPCTDLTEKFQGTDLNNPTDHYGLRNTTANATTREIKTRFRHDTYQNAVNYSYLWTNNLNAGWSGNDTFNGVRVRITEQAIETGPGYEILEVTVTVIGGVTDRLFFMLDLQPWY